MLYKTFNNDLIDLPELETETINGLRHYVVSGDIKYPSVTSVLDRTADKRWLEEWKKNVGEEEANKISGRARARGSALHNLAERYVKNQEVNKSKEMPINWATFLQLKVALDENVDNIRAVEACLWSKKMMVAGRVDMVSDWKQIPSVIDFKTSNKEKKASDILDYFLQATIYAYMFWERTGIVLKQIVIILCVDGRKEPQVFVDNPANYTQLVYDRITQYHSM